MLFATLFPNFEMKMDQKLAQKHSKNWVFFPKYSAFNISTCQKTLLAKIAIIFSYGYHSRYTVYCIPNILEIGWRNPQRHSTTKKKLWLMNLLANETKRKKDMWPWTTELSKWPQTMKIQETSLSTFENWLICLAQINEKIKKKSRLYILFVKSGYFIT